MLRSGCLLLEKAKRFGRKTIRGPSTKSIDCQAKAAAADRGVSEELRVCQRIANLRVEGDGCEELLDEIMKSGAGRRAVFSEDQVPDRQNDSLPLR